MQRAQVRQGTALKLRVAPPIGGQRRLRGPQLWEQCWWLRQNVALTLDHCCQDIMPPQLWRSVLVPWIALVQKALGGIGGQHGL